MYQVNKTSYRTLKLLVNLTLLLNGCALLPEEGTRAKLLPLPTISETVRVSPESEAIVQAWPKAQWWQDFHNPELNRLMETALHNSPTLKAAAARLNQAEAGADYKAADMLPSITASAEIHQQRFSGTDFYGPNGGKTFLGAYLDPLVFRYHLDLWGKDRAALDAALGKERAQASELAMVKLILSTTIARSYFGLAALEQASHLAKGLVTQHEEKLHLTQLRWQRGLEPQDAVYASSQKLEAAQQRHISLRTQVQRLRNQMAALAGQGSDWGLGIRLIESQFVQHFPLPENLSLGLLAHRPDVAASLWRAESAAQLMKVAKTNFYPDVNLVGFSGLRSLNLKDLFLSNAASVAYSVGPTITLPIFEGGRLEAELKNEQAGYDVAIETYNATLLTAVQQVADSLANWRETVAQDERQERAVKAAESANKLAEKRYQAGLSSRDGVIEARFLLLEQQMKTTELTAEHLQAAVALIAALGGGYENQQSTQTILGKQP